MTNPKITGDILSPKYLGFFPSGTPVTVSSERGDATLRSFEHPVAATLSELDTHKSALYFVLETAKLLRRIMTEKATLDLGADLEALEVTIWEAIIVGYARCFDGNAPYHLQASGYLDQRQLANHEHFYWLRQRHVAHDLNGFRESITGIEVTNEAIITGIQWLHVVHTRTLAHLDDLVELIELAGSEVAKSMVDSGFEFLANAKALSPAELLALPILTHSGPASMLPEVVRPRHRPKCPFKNAV